MSERRTALVTGADRGLGFAIVKRLLQENFTVFAGEYMSDYPLLQNLKASYEDQLYLVELDVQNAEHMKAAAAEIERIAGKLDLLVSNAAIMGVRTERPSDVIDGNRGLDLPLLTRFFMTNSFMFIVWQKYTPTCKL